MYSEITYIMYCIASTVDDNCTVHSKLAAVRGVFVSWSVEVLENKFIKCLSLDVYWDTCK